MRVALQSGSRMDKIRNIAIIAHVDHGKTTLVDQLLRQSGTFRANQKVEERVMDSMDLEREKGITIRAKNAAFHWNGYRINIVDTPGHADFGGEVERIMKMVDGVLLVVDAHDGPQATTRFVLRIALGRIVSGRVNVGDSIVCIHRNGERERATVTTLFTYSGLEQVEIKHASAGDIVGLTGFEEIFIGETLTDREERAPLQFVDIDPPTIRMRILVNDSPFAGREGKFVTARHLNERLVRETRTNVSLEVSETETAGAFEINARGEMQIAILVEQMRREGYELMVSRPEVIYRRDAEGNLLEPIENLYVEIPK